MAGEQTRGTLALALRDAMPVRTLVVEVREGPDQGLCWQGERCAVGTGAGNELQLTDPTVSGYHVRLTAQKHGVEVSDFGSTNGTRVGELRIDRGVVPPGTTLTVGRTKLSVGAGLPSTVPLHDEDKLGALRGSTAPMRRLMRDVRRVAPSSVAVLLIGESGTGKELIARAVHEASSRATRPFVTVDCGSLTPTLVASELFGHEQGSFTGAHKLKKGAFEHAHGGTLFLDEIGELAPDLQIMLLGALERKRFTRVGGNGEIEVDVRIVAATNRDLRAEVNAGQFRLDLYYRLAVVMLEIPTLRERSDDIPLLVEHFAREEGFTGAISTLIPPDTLGLLRKHRWPGNVRELRNFVQATIAMGEPVALRDEDDSRTERDRVAFERLSRLPYGQARALLLGEFEAHYVQALIERHHGNVARASREAEMARSHLHELLRRHNVRGDAG